MKASMPLYQVDKCSFSLGECWLSSGKPNPVNTESTPVYFCNWTTTPIEPPSRLNNGRLPQVCSSAFAIACTPALSVSVIATPELCKLVTSHRIDLGACFFMYCTICLCTCS